MMGLAVRVDDEEAVRPGWRRRDLNVAIAILLVALAARVAYVLATPGYRLQHDDKAYDRLALGIARTGAYPDVGGHATAYRPPGFPYLLGAVYAVAGRGHARVVAGRMVEAILGVVIVALLGALASRVFDRRAAIFTMALAAVYVPLVTAGTSLLAEPLTIVLELGAISAVLAWRRHQRWGWVVAAGVMGGLLTLTRSNAFVVVIALAAGVWPFGRRLSVAALKPVAVVLAAAVLTVAPWTVRNAVVLHSFIPVSDELGGTLAGTYNPVSAGDSAAPAFWHLLSQIPQYDSQTRALASGPESPFQSRLVHLALQYVEHHPLYPLKVAFYNSLRLVGFNSLSLSEFTATDAGIASPGVADAGVFSFWAIGALALVGALNGRVRKGVPGFMWLAVGLLFLSIVLVNSEAPRLRLPIDPFVLLLAGAGLSAASRWIGTSSRRLEPRHGGLLDSY
jgi:Dolichyl-phosphate-mannose-protein mannosyltransferase